ncbi:Retrovirus-related Pol polyprotein from transposon 17.6 [Dictyocoela muelleri]|nr:Retrovirus-related Pol polyprotein from transposon 17.6 [Dictyocoela muelleri]
MILDGIKNCIVYIDDIVIYAKTTAEHNDIVFKVLERLKDYNVKINFDKRKFLVEELEILGNIIMNGIIKVDTENIEKLINLGGQVKTKRDIQKIIGIITWYRNFIPNVSRKISKLTQLLKKNTDENGAKIIKGF